MTAQELTDRIVAQSRDYSTARGLSKEAAAAHLYSTLTLELTAALESAGEPYRQRLHLMLEEQAPRIDPSEADTPAPSTLEP